MFKEYNPNPLNLKVSDCVVRALSKALKTDWKTAYMLTVVKGMALGDIMTANHVWGAVLADHDFKRYAIPNTCPDCYTIKEFAADHPMGVYVLGTGSHAVTVEDGDYYDSWDSGDEVPVYYWSL